MPLWLTTHHQEQLDTAEGEGRKQDTQTEPQIDSVGHKDLLDAVLHDLKTEERKS